MPHISYSELKDWVHCAFYHKLTRIDKIDGFKGNAFTAFGTAVHSVCEKKLLQEEVDDDYFVQQFEECLEKLDDDIEINQKFTKENLRIIRPGNGLAPKYYNKVLGRKVNKKLKKGTAVKWDYLQ